MGIVRSNLRVLMAERNLNIQKVKDNTTLSRTTISNLVNNYGAGIQFDTISQLCKLLNCRPGDLITYYDVEVEFEAVSGLNGDQIDYDFDNLYLMYRDVRELTKEVPDEHQIRFFCKLEYEKEVLKFEFEILFHFVFEEEKEYGEFEHRLFLNGKTSKVFQSKLEELELPYYVESYIKEELNDYISNIVTEKAYKDLDGWEGTVIELNISNA